MQAWEEWFPSEVDKRLEVFPRLVELSIVGCPQLLGRFPDHLPSLKKLLVNKCGRLTVSLSGLPRLCKLEIEQCQEVVHEVGNELKHTSLNSVVLSNVTCLTEGLMQCLTEVEDLVIVGCHELTSLSQKELGLLQHLTSLRHLVIKSCPQFFSLAETEEEEDERQKQQRLSCMLESLDISACQNLERLQGVHDFASLRELKIEGLPGLISFPEIGLPSMLRMLTIKSCDALISISGVMMHDRSNTSLEFLCIEECCSLMSVARCGVLSTIKKLEIINCSSLESLLDEEAPSSPPSLTMCYTNGSGLCLEELRISVCFSLTSLTSRGELPATLKHLCFEGCPKLELIAERLHSNTSLESIHIWFCENLKVLPQGLHSLTNLLEFELIFCESLVSFPDGGLAATNLIALTITDCDKLEALPNCIHNLTSLQRLTLERSPSVVTFPEEGFPTNLTSVRMTDFKICTPLFEWGLDRFTSLETLEIDGGCSDMVSFPIEEEGMMLPNTLTSLTIKNFLSLEYLSRKGFQNLTSLEYLKIAQCPKLKSFPKVGLPPSLTQLYIYCCPLLEEKCKRDQGPYWPLIAHIPYLSFNFIGSIYDPEDEEEEEEEEEETDASWSSSSEEY